MCVKMKAVQTRLQSYFHWTTDNKMVDSKRVQKAVAALTKETELRRRMESIESSSAANASNEIE